MHQSFQIIVESSIAQKEYVKYITQSKSQNKCYMAMEVNLFNVNVETIEKSLAFFVKRHESLRTIFSVTNEEVNQVILPYDNDLFKLNSIELCSKDEFMNKLKEIYDKSNEILLNLEKGPLVKFYLVKRDQYNFIFIFLIHHIICDAWSMRLIEKELLEIYTSYLKGEEPQLVPLKFQLKDYCIEQNITLNERRNNLGVFWTNKLHGFKKKLDLKNFYRTYAIRHYNLVQEEEVCKYNTIELLTEVLNKDDSAFFLSNIIDSDFIRIDKLAQQKNCSISIILYTSLYILVYIYGRKKEVLLAALIADRGSQENKNLIGCLLGGTYLPIKLREECLIDELIEEVFLLLSEAVQNVIFSHDFIGLEGMELRTSCDIYVNYISDDISLNSDEVQPSKQGHKQDEGIYYAMNCLVNEYKDGMIIKWRYNKSLFAEELIEDIINCHKSIIDFLTNNNQFTLKELASILNYDNNSPCECPPKKNSTF